MKTRAVREKSPEIEYRALFLDIGGVLLTDGWDHNARRRAVTKFKLEPAKLEERHHLVFETYEEGKLTLDEYLDWVIFHQKRPFTRRQFRDFMFAQSKPYPEMIRLITRLKDRYGPRIFVVSNEARAINAYRIKKFKLDGFVDGFISSSFVHLRKPDVGIFRLALDIAQVRPQEVLFIDDTPLFVEVADSLGIRSILHKEYPSTCEKLTAFGLEIKS